MSASFESTFIIPVSRTQMYRQMGNSVAIPVVEAVAKQITETLKFINNNYEQKNNQEEQTHIAEGSFV